MTDFIPFPKIARLNRDIVITEKLDGTNAQVFIDDATMLDNPIAVVDGLGIMAGSRSRWITPEQDNFGFARWAVENAEELVKLGEGSHFGEWWGKGIQRGYGMEGRKFSLFNVSRWADPDVRPACCDVVPTLYQGPMDQYVINDIVLRLSEEGSIAVPGFMSPEGIIVYHTAANLYFKVTCKDDEKPKGN